MLPWSACPEAGYCTKLVFGPAWTVLGAFTVLGFKSAGHIAVFVSGPYSKGWAEQGEQMQQVLLRPPLPCAGFLLTELQPQHQHLCLTSFQMGKYVSLVLFLYCKPSLDLQSIYSSTNLPFKCSQPLWELYHSYRYFPFKAASLSSNGDIWDGKYFRIPSYWKQSCSP